MHNVLTQYFDFRESEDTILLMLKEIYAKMGIAPVKPGQIHAAPLRPPPMGPGASIQAPPMMSQSPLGSPSSHHHQPQGAPPMQPPPLRPPGSRPSVTPPRQSYPANPTAGPPPMSGFVRQSPQRF